MSRFDLTGKTAIVTGGASGIGLETSRALAEQGAAVLVADMNLETATTAAEAITKAGGKAVPVRADVSRAPDADGMIEAALKQFGRLDILVNNAGIVIPGTVLQTSETDWDRLFSVNCKGLFLCCRAAIPVFQKQGGGSIVNIASVAGLVAVRDRFAYCATKGAVVSMTRALAIDHVADKIRVNCVCPGTVHTQLVDKYIREFYEPQGKSRNEVLAMLNARQPMNRMAQPVEIANAVVYLASDEAAFITGSALVIDGGTTAV